MPEDPTNDEQMSQAEQDTQMEELTSKVTNAYGEDQIQVLEGLEAVRKRPGMYVGDNGKRGLHQMFREVLDNSVDEVLAGYCTEIKVKIFTDGSLSVEDNGRGIPVGTHKKMGVSTLQVVMTVLHAGGKFDDQGGYKASGGLHGVGVSCTNALSSWLVATVRREGETWEQRYEQGIPVTEVIKTGKSTKNGTTVHWMPDPTVLTETTHDTHIITARMKELAYLNPTASFEFVNEEHPEQNATYHFSRGIPQLVEDMNEGKTTLHKVIAFKRVKDSTQVEVALQYHDSYSSSILAYSNNIHQPDGGTHVSGFNTALTRVINSYARRMNFLKEKDNNFTSEDVSEGLMVAISLRLTNPSYNSQDKVKLVTPEVQGLTNSLVGDGLTTFFEENPNIGRQIVQKAITAQRAREAARKAAETVRRSNSMDSYGLPGKLQDCVSKDPTKCEIFLVEGDSAGGSAKGARDRLTQAVLPLKGKILNVERARIDKALENEEIKSLIMALGAGIDLNLGRKELYQETLDEDGELVRKDPKERNVEFNIDKLRYSKIIIMTDADVDGQHIRTLLLTFFYRYMRQLIENGNIYLAQPPLFVIKVGPNERYYAMDEKERDEIIRNVKKRKFDIQRFKGLGEMNAEQLEETTMAPSTRKLIQVQYDPEQYLDVEQMFSRLMGDKVEPRREFIEKHAREALNLDWHH